LWYPSGQKLRMDFLNLYFQGHLKTCTDYSD
jgi:hypothetical protein